MFYKIMVILLQLVPSMPPYKPALCLNKTNIYIFYYFRNTATAWQCGPFSASHPYRHIFLAVGV